MVHCLLQLDVRMSSALENLCHLQLGLVLSYASAIFVRKLLAH